MQQQANVRLGVDRAAGRREQLLRATMACIAEAGLEKTTIRMVADRIGVTTGMVLYYFASKRQLLVGVVELAVQDFRAELDAVAGEAVGLERLAAGLQRFLASEPAGRNYVSVLDQCRNSAATDHGLRDLYQAIFQAYSEEYEHSVQAAKESGELRPDIDASLASDLIYALAQGLTSESALLPERFPVERCVDIALTTLGFLKEAPRPGEPAPVPVGLGCGADAPSGQMARVPDTSMPDVIASLLLADGRLEGHAARDLADSVRLLYDLALRASAP